jgi:predicted Zn-dependent peptidase
MMASSTPYCKKTDWLALHTLRYLMLALLFALLPLASHAEGMHIKSAELIASETGYSLEANYEISLSHTLEEALLRGLALPFVIDFELTYPRWWTLSLWNRTVAELHQQHRLSYNALTRQYRVSFGSLNQNFDTLEEALGVIARVRQQLVFTRDEVDADSVYIAALRLRLDTSQLPKPLQINALGSRDWNLSSDWYRWTFRP